MQTKGFLKMRNLGIQTETTEACQHTRDRRETPRH